MTTPKKPTAPSAATLAKKLKTAEANLATAEQALIELNKYCANERAQYGNEQYTLGFDEGYNQGKIEAAVAKADAGIARFFRK